MTSLVPNTGRTPSSGRTGCPRGFLLLTVCLAYAGVTCVPTAETRAQAAGEATAEPSASELRVRARILSVEASTTLDEASKTALLAQYQQVIEVLAVATEHRATAATYAQALQTAVQEAAAIRGELATRGPDPLSGLTVGPDSDVSTIDRELQTARSDESRWGLTIRQLDGRIDSASARQHAIRARQLELRAELARATSNTEATSARTLVAASAEEARAWLEQAKLEALEAEQERLELELRSAPARLMLQEAQRDQARLDVTRAHARVEAMTGWLSNQRRAETERVIADSGASLVGAVRSHPLVAEHLAANQALADMLAEETNALAAALASNASAATRLTQVERRLDDTRQQLELGGMSQALGHYLAEERRALTGLSTYHRDSGAREEALAEAGLRGIRLDQTRRDLLSLDTYVADSLSDYSGADVTEVGTALRSLAESRQELVRQAIDINHHYRQTLAELEYREAQLQTQLDEFNVLLSERLLWVRSASTLGIEDLQRLPRETRDLLAPVRWRDAAVGMLRVLPTTPGISLYLLLFGLWLLGRRALRRRLHASAARVGRPSEDRMQDTLLALLLTLALTLPWVGLLWTTGWLASHAAESSNAAISLGTELQRLSPLVFFVLFFRELCAREGVAEAHLGLATGAINALRRDFTLLLVTFVAPAFLLVVHLGSGGAGGESALTRVLFLALLGSLSAFAYRLLEPRNGIAYRLWSRQAQTGWAWLILALAIPACLALMVFVGYTYSAGLLLGKLLATLWLLFGLALVRELIVRWLVIVRRRIAWREAYEAPPNHEALPAPMADQTISDGRTAAAERSRDIVSVSDDTQKLVNTTLVVAGLVALSSIWSPLLAAFSFFSEVVLWRTQEVLNGEQAVKSITLYHVATAALISVATLACVRHVPALLEIVLRQRPNITAGSRLAFATLARYALGLLGVSAAAGSLGIDWSKIQWLVAALGVGIGFGLQEIVANFVSGLFILIERPIRVGDTVTVGDASGTVTDIRLRATTIRTWDRQELLVPNKEFITGRVLNWTLSDGTVRIYFTLGIAYGSDVELALKLLEQIAREHPTTLRDPAPVVTFEGFAESTMTLGLRCFVPSLDDRLKTTTDLHRAINEEYEKAGLDIAVPQRQVHLTTLSPLEVRVLPEERSST